jgi:RNA polymerase sigma-70 factor (ECF subfamily)
MDEWIDSSDPRLVVLVARGHRTALAEIFRRYGGSAFGLAVRVLRDAALAEDVVQDVFVRLWREPERYDAARGTLRGFLLGQVRARAIEVIRAETARRAREARATSEAAVPVDVENEVWTLITADRVRDALQTLSEAERRAIELAYFGGCSYREVARLLEEPEGTVKTRIRSGLRRLRGVLDPAEVSHP